jgi:hypothetical protein
MCDALNLRIHDAKIQARAPTVTAARGQRIAVGDLVISRRNDSAVRIYDAARDVPAADAVRNGTRWRVVAVDVQRNRIAARRLGDGARAIFDDDYVREHVGHGYAVTVHAAQGVTADTAHAVLGENASRALLYVAMTRGRESNSAYLYERVAEASEYNHDQLNGLHIMRRAGSRLAANLMRAIIGTDHRAETAYRLAAGTDPEQLPPLVARLLIDRHAQAVQMRRATYQSWQAEARQRQASLERDFDQHLSRDREQSTGCGLEL